MLMTTFVNCKNQTILPIMVMGENDGTKNPNVG